MKSWKRITLVAFVLIGGTISFGYWSISQFDSAFDNLSASYLANTNSPNTSSKQKVGLSSSSPDISGELATSTDPGLASSSPDISLELATSTDPGLASTSPEASLDDPELSFNFPKNDTEVYIGCTYTISWQSSTTISSLEAALIDGGTREPMGPIASGIAKENTIEKDLQNLEWKVGSVWPGGYYIKISKINGIEVELRSKYFEINKMSKNISPSEKENICKGSGGSF